MPGNNKAAPITTIPTKKQSQWTNNCVNCPCQSFQSDDAVTSAVNSDARAQALIEWLSGSWQDDTTNGASCSSAAEDTSSSVGQRCAVTGCANRLQASIIVLNAIRDACRPYLESPAPPTPISSILETPNATKKSQVDTSRNETYQDSFPSLTTTTSTAVPTILVGRRKSKGPKKHNGINPNSAAGGGEIHVTTTAAAAAAKKDIYSFAKHHDNGRASKIGCTAVGTKKKIKPVTISLSSNSSSSWGKGFPPLTKGNISSLPSQDTAEMMRGAKTWSKPEATTAVVTGPINKSEDFNKGANPLLSKGNLSSLTSENNSLMVKGVHPRRLDFSSQDNATEAEGQSNKLRNKYELSSQQKATTVEVHSKSAENNLDRGYKAQTTKSKVSSEKNEQNDLDLKNNTKATIVEGPPNNKMRSDVCDLTDESNDDKNNIHDGFANPQTTGASGYMPSSCTSSVVADPRTPSRNEILMFDNHMSANEKQDRLASIYSTILKHHLAPFLLLELHLLVRLISISEKTTKCLMSGGNDQTQANLAFADVFQSEQSCRHFAAQTLTALEFVIVNLGHETIKMFASLPAIRRLCPNMLTTLQNAIHAGNSALMFEADQKALGANTNTPHLTLPFDHARDSRHNYRSADLNRLFKEREEMRDSFLYQLRAFQDVRGRLVDNEQAEKVIGSIKRESREMLNNLSSGNIVWFVNFFCDLLFQIGLVPIGETDSEVLQHVTDQKRLQVGSFLSSVVFT